MDIFLSFLLIFRDHPEKSFAQDYEKVLMAFVLSIGRILGNICHDHPLHSDAVILGEESKRFYQVCVFTQVNYSYYY